jgi:hypothetical protein
MPEEKKLFDFVTNTKEIDDLLKKAELIFK